MSKKSPVLYIIAMQKRIPTTADHSLSRAELSRRWSCSQETLKRREKAGVLSSWKNGRLVRFRMTDVIEYEQQGQVLPSANLQNKTQNKEEK